LRGRTFLLAVTIVALYALIVVGAWVAAGNYGEACGSSASWPLCNGQLLPSPQFGVVIEYMHRLLAVTSALLLFGTTFVFWKSNERGSRARVLLLLSSLLMVVQIGLGDVVIGAGLEAALVALHQANALLIFGLTVGAAAAGRG